ncbi:MAG: DUF2834 domain-containing protein [Pseudomonadota bacterium]
MSNTKHTPLFWLYVIAALVGIAATWYHNLAFIEFYGEFSLGTFIRDSNINAAASSIAIDITVVAVVFSIWSFVEARRVGMSFWWVYFALTFFIALAFAMPLFLAMRERALQRTAQATHAGI